MTVHYLQLCKPPVLPLLYGVSLPCIIYSYSDRILCSEFKRAFNIKDLLSPASRVSVINNKIVINDNYCFVINAQAYTISHF